MINKKDLNAFIIDLSIESEKLDLTTVNDLKEKMSNIELEEEK